jgi:hypothetical protein
MDNLFYNLIGSNVLLKKKLNLGIKKRLTKFSKEPLKKKLNLGIKKRHTKFDNLI